MQTTTDDGEVIVAQNLLLDYILINV